MRPFVPITKTKFSYLYKGKYLTLSELYELPECVVSRATLSNRLLRIRNKLKTKFVDIEQCVKEGEQWIQEKNEHHEDEKESLKEFIEDVNLWSPGSLRNKARIIQSK